MKKIYLRLTLSIAFIFSIFSLALADTYPKREIRAAWVTPINGNWPATSERGTTSSHIQAQKNHAIAIIEEMKANGFNAIFVHARPYSDRMFLKTSYTHNGKTYTVYEPFSHHVSNTRGTETSYDPLAFWVEECHKRGMECHAWINPLRFCNTAGDVTTPGWPCNSLNVDKEVWNNGWIIYQYQASESSKTTKFCYDPSLSEVRTRINNVCAVIAGNYDVDGIVWDDYFYPDGIPEDSSAGDYDRYQSYLSNGGTMSMANWRRENCNTMIREAYKSIKSIKPYIKFGLAPAGAGGGNPRNCAFTDKEKSEISVLNGNINLNVTWSDWQYNTIYADLIAWLREGTIDYISPQLYWSTKHGTNPFDKMCQWWQEVSSYFGRHCYPSHGFSGGYTNNGKVQEDWDEIITQIKATREVAITNAPGSIFYPANYFDAQMSDFYNSGLAGKTLSGNVYQKKALVPAITWQNATNPGKPQNLNFTSGKLSWDNATMNEGSVTGIGMRHAIYAIPLSVGLNDAKSTIHANDGGFKADYLLDVTYSNSFDVSSYPSSSYWYAVTIVDRYGNEWEAATINEPAFGDVSLSLNSPANNVSNLPFGDNTFSWTSDGSSFTFQISTSENFTDPLIEEVVTTNNITVSTANFTDGATYYWRVIASKENYNSAWSEVRSFTMEVRPFVSLTLLTPENASTIDSETVAFSWQGEEGANYTLEVAEFSSFNNIIISKNTTSTSYEITTSSLTGGKTYFWRIKATKEGTQSSVSSYSSFKIPKVEGELVDGITIEQKWQITADKFPENLASPRSMAAYNGNVYILERTTSTDCSLLKFNGNTGEYEGKITLLTTGDCYKNSSGASLGYPCNSIFVDGAGNLCVANMTLNLQKEQLTVCTVNVSTGATTRIFESKLSSNSYRIDYSNAFNNVTATGGQIWAATTSNKVFCWTNNGNGEWTETSTTINDYYPAVVTALGTAPYIQPISSTQFIVDGASTHPALYTFNSGSTATLNSSFADNAAIQPMNALSNGTCSITIGNTPLFVYVDDNHNGSGHSFSIVANKHNFDFSQFQFMKSIPENKLGKVQHDYALDQTVAIKNDDGSATIFLYAPKNGLAAYRISLPEIEISLNSPADNTTFEEDFDFSWSGVEGASYTLEISKTATFEDIAFTATTTSTNYNSSNFNLASETQYFWRVKASHPNYTSATSEIRQFTSPVKQSAIDNLTITELWNKSVNKNSIPSQINSTAQRSMVAYNGNVYVITRETGELLEFNGSTGAYNRTITLTGDCFTNSSGTKLGFPTNCIFVDGNNNLCVSNLVTSFSTNNPLTVCTIDVNTGNTTRIFQSNITESIRVDYANAFGDVTKDGAQIWASTNATKVLRWTRKNGSWVYESTTINSFYPTSATSLGTAPWVMPISETDFLVDGSSNAPTRYTFNASGNATYKSGFDSNKSLAPSYTTTGKAYGAGMGQITLGKYPLFIYNNDNQNGNGHNYNVVHNPSFYDFSQMEKLWTVPENYLGKETHSSILNPIACLKNTDNSATVFVYAPMNGLAAYRISLPEMNLLLTSPANDETVEKGFDFTWKGVAGSEYTLEVSTTSDFNNIAFSTITDGASYSSTNFKLAPATKYYWRVIAKNDNFTTTTSSVGQFTTAALPMLPITLTSPIDNVQTEQGFDFSWTGVEGSTYTIELSTSETFDDIAFSATTESTTYQSSNFNLANSTQYYWRVIAANDNYTTTTSTVGQFISPVKPTMTPPQLFKPYNETTHSSDISFVAKKSYLMINEEKVYTTKTTLEISKDPNFSEIYFTGNSNWKEESSINSNYEIWLQYTVPISYFANGTYYWRVIAESVDPNLEDGVSEVRQFKVEGQSEAPGTAETNYTPKHEDNYEYDLIKSGSNYYTFTNLWIRNDKKNSIGQTSTGLLHRDFCARSAHYGDQDGKDVLWIPGREGNYSATAYLDKYNANTGEYIGRITLTGNYASSIAACNSLFLDGAGRLCMTNLAAANGTLQLATINPTNGAVTIKQTLSVPERIDHTRVIGDIESGEAYIFATSSDATVYRWKLIDGKLSNNTYESRKMTSFYPTTSTKFGTETRIYPIDSEHFYLDGDGTAFTLYNFSSSTAKSTFAAFPSCAPLASNRGNGGTFFSHDGKYFILYSSSAFEKTSDTDFEYKFNLANVSEFTSWGSMNKYWTLPNESIGTVINANEAYGMLADYLQYDAVTGTAKNSNIQTYSSGYDRTNVYIYVPGNGMAAYSLTRHIYTGAEGINAQNIKIGVNAQEITFGCDVNNAQIYTLSGMLINSVDNASSIEKPATKGVYIIQLSANGTVTTHKIII